MILKSKKLKNNLTNLIKSKSILEYKNYNTEVPEENFIVATILLLKIINKPLLNKFLSDFQKIIIHKNLPIFKAQQVVRIYKIWLKNHSYIDNLIYLSNTFNKNIINQFDNKNWDTILKYSYNYKSNEMYALINIAAEFQRIINNNNGINNEVLEKLFNLKFNNNIPLNITVIEKYIQHKYSSLFTIINCQKDLWSNHEHIYLLSMKFNYSAVIPKLSADKTRVFNQFLKIILNQNLNYIFRYSILELFNIFQIYLLKPELFKNLNIPKNELKLPPIPTIIATNNNKYNYYISLGNLLNHLSQTSFVFPIAFIQKYLNLNNEQKIIFFNILKGQSVRKQSLPFTMSRKAEHIFIIQKTIDKNTTIYEEAVIAEYLSKGVEYSYALRASSLLTRNKDENNYYIHIFISLYKRGFSKDYIQETYDYMKVNQFFETNNKSFKTKTIINIIRDVEQYHEEHLTHNSKSINKIQNIKFAQDANTKEITIDDNSYEFVPLQSSKDLFIEGAIMKHCVYNYVPECITGEVIYSLRKKTMNNKERLLTIEVDNNNRVIQIRGEHNRKPRPHEMEVIQLWAKKSGVSLMHQ